MHCAQKFVSQPNAKEQNISIKHRSHLQEGMVMRKNTIALLLSVVLAAGSIGAVPVWAAETTEEVAATTEEAAATTEEAAATTEEAATETTEEAAAEAITGMTAEIAFEEESAQESVSQH